MRFIVVGDRDACEGFAGRRVEQLDAGIDHEPDQLCTGALPTPRVAAIVFKSITSLAVGFCGAVAAMDLVSVTHLEIANGFSTSA